jgi:hypothetical protein
MLSWPVGIMGAEFLLWCGWIAPPLASLPDPRKPLDQVLVRPRLR